jgi:hypothetical protein
MPILTSNVANTLDSLGIHLYYNSAVGCIDLEPNDLPLIEKIGIKAYDAKRLGLPLDQLDEYICFQQGGCQCKAITVAGKQCSNMAANYGFSVEEFRNRNLYCHTHSPIRR